jgi:hypothetical protein
MDRAAIRQGLVEELAYLVAYDNPRSGEVRAALAAHDAVDRGEDVPPEVAVSDSPMERALPRRARRGD